jgi:hypothetical protein
MELLMPYIAAATILALVIIRIIKGKKQGPAAVKLEIIYLLVYSFFCGVATAFFISQPGFGWLMVMAIFVFVIGFVLRLIPLFRLIEDVEKKFQNAQKMQSENGI